MPLSPAGWGLPYRELSRFRTPCSEGLFLGERPASCSTAPDTSMGDFMNFVFAERTFEDWTLTGLPLDDILPWPRSTVNLLCGVTEDLISIVWKLSLGDLPTVCFCKLSTCPFSKSTCACNSLVLFSSLCNLFFNCSRSKSNSLICFSIVASICNDFLLSCTSPSAMFIDLAFSSFNCFCASIAFCLSSTNFSTSFFRSFINIRATCLCFAEFARSSSRLARVFLRSFSIFFVLLFSKSTWKQHRIF